MYKNNIDEMMSANLKQESGISRDTSLNSIRSEDVKSTVGSEPQSPVESNNSTTSLIKINQDIKSLGLNTNAQYRRLCDKLGMDLSSVGELTVHLKHCDRLPESLFSISVPQFPSQVTSPTSQSSTQQPSSQSTQTNPDPGCYIYLTMSIDPVSMKDLMDRQICKDSWPTIEFEVTRINPTQLIGFVLNQLIFVNKTEVVIQKILPNSLVSILKKIRPFDVIYSVNNVRISSIKQFNKIIQKTAINIPIKFVVQRPCVVLESTKIASTLQKRQSIQEPSQALPEAVSSNPPNKELSPQNSVANPTPNNSSSLVSNTRLRFEKLEQKIKNSFACAPLAITNSIEPPFEYNTAIPRIPSSGSIPNLAVNPQSTQVNSLPGSPTLGQNQPPAPSILASASTLVDFFCSVAESELVNYLLNFISINLY